MENRRTVLGLIGAAATSLLLFGRSGNAAPALRFAMTKAPAEWRRQLGPQRYAILREAATERPFSSPLLKEHRKGTFTCAGCGQALFSSATKFESGTGWPSFWKPLSGAVATRTDRKLIIARTEVLCARCGGHLGHVFEDGPKPTGLRYCMNGLALNFRVA
ncbi:MAG TPA: peptide-methionine (R)-S-oxide reductase MsrB [Sphingomicrobium sp.]